MRCDRAIQLLLAALLLALCLLWIVRQPAPRESPSGAAVATGGIETGMRHPPGQGHGTTAPQGQYRLANTTQPLDRLIRNPRAILLENALLDTTQPLNLAIPASLRAKGDPGTYIVQARGPLEDVRALLRQSGASIVSYIPNNAFLVRASDEVARRLEAAPATAAVAPYEPYYKLKAWLLKAAVEQTPLPANSTLRLLLFSDARDETLDQLSRLGMQVLSEQPSTFGPIIEVASPGAGLPAEGGVLAQPWAGQGVLPKLAQLAGVQEMELARRRVPANDLSRVTTGVALDSVTLTNYLGLTGNNVLVALADSGVDAAHPDLVNRVFGDSANSTVDQTGHGTHVAGVIAGNGTESVSVTNASGSVMPAAKGQFRGKAPGATLFSMTGGSDNYLQQTAARTNALISNNSWTYAGNEYDLAAASYDAAVRDALPDVPGPQPLVFVFSAGNAGGGNNDGTGGNADSVQSPATAKNVITVGALEQCRRLTNETWTGTTNAATGAVTWQTNQPWLDLTSASNQIAGFSSRGNVGLGVEADFGRFKPDLVAPGTFVVSARSGQWDQAAYYSPTNPALVISSLGNSLVVLSNLNDAMGWPAYYRYESGTSLAAAEVAGALALMEEFFQQGLQRTNSPALLKAMLINGARSLGGPWDFCVTNPVNSQGWGRLSLPTSLPGVLTNLNSAPAASSMWLFDQDPPQALATGQSCTRVVRVAPEAQSLPLRVTLVWTDPPANPVAGLKLVNDLDLVVTNLDTGEVYFGNDIPAGSVTNRPWNVETPPNQDRVNNVENVFLSAAPGASYSITVTGQRVNVNAVSAQAQGAAQDYALVISSGDGEIPNAITLASTTSASITTPLVTVVTNQFAGSPTDAGAILLGQRVGANGPLAGTNTVPLANGAGVITLGSVNQWHFYILTNDTAYTNAAFVTFLAPTLAVLDLNSDDGSVPSQTVRPDADIDLYVSQDPGLINLDPIAVAQADKSLGRGGAEAIVYTNASPCVYYIGVKSESQEAAQYGLIAMMSELPFSQADDSGNLILRGVPAPAPIPDGTPERPGRGYVVAVAPGPVPVHRVIVTNTITHEMMSDLTGTLTHLGTRVVLNNHSTNQAVVDMTFIYDDSGQGDVPGGQAPAGPGTLRSFAGQDGGGQWLLTQTDTVPDHVGTDDSLWLFVEAQPDLTSGLVASILPGACRDDHIYLPMGTTNLTAEVSLLSGTGPVSMELGAAAAVGSFSTGVTTNTTGVLTVNKFVMPPLNPGDYVLRLCNSGPDAVTVSNFVLLAADPNPVATSTYKSTNAVAIADDALTSAGLYVDRSAPVASVDVGVRIVHPRISDLVLRLVSPSGTRVLLDENRGGASTEGMGLSTLLTNSTPVYSSGGAAPSTNVLETGLTSGTILMAYRFYAQPDDMTVYYDGHLIFDSGPVSTAGADYVLTNINYGPGTGTTVTIIMNQNRNPDPGDVWDYVATTTAPGFIYGTFTEDTNLTITPIKFAPVPFTNVQPVTVSGVASNGIFFLPEESLAKVAGEPALGQWRLEIEDTRAGPSAGTNPPPALLGWELTFVFADTVPAPIPLTHDQTQTNSVGPGRTQYFSLDVPSWASFATNSLLWASAPVNLLFNQSGPPSATNAAGNFTLLAGSTGGDVVLGPSPGQPPLVPGSVCYFGVQNTNALPVSFAFEMDFDVPVLANGVPDTGTVAAGAPPSYFAYDVSGQATAVWFQLADLDGNVDLFAQYGLPFPSATNFDYSSANPATNEQQILVFAGSGPVPLAPGRWYLGVFNADTNTVSYTILAEEFTVLGANVTVTDYEVSSNSLCFTWASTPGLCYYVQGATDSTGTNWANVSRTLLATGSQTSFCVPLPSPFQSFLVQQGILPGTNLAPVSITGVSIVPAGFQLQWQAPVGSQFQVQWSPVLGPASWTPFPDLITSPGVVFSFLDDGSQTGGLDAARFYRVLELP
jgi:subtilisin-like proprotein convertase family protein